MATAVTAEEEQGVRECRRMSKRKRTAGLRNAHGLRLLPALHQQHLAAVCLLDDEQQTKPPTSRPTSIRSLPPKRKTRIQTCRAQTRITRPERSRGKMERPSQSGTSLLQYALRTRPVEQGDGSRAQRVWSCRTRPRTELVSRGTPPPPLRALNTTCTS